MTQNTIAIVTGASRGLGKAIALRLLENGVPVITIARHNNDVLSSTAKKSNTPLTQLQVDLSDPVALTQLGQTVNQHIGTDISQCILINNAGTVQPVAPTQNLSDAAAINAALTLNITSIMVLCSAILTATNRPGVERRILNISSGAGRNPMPGWAVYCATKAAVDHYTRVLAQENTNVRAVALAPGVVDTDMQAAIRSSQPADFPNVQRFIDMHESGQLATPAHVAEHIIQYIQRDDFGTTVLDDIREYS